jgi:hypothetical protein
MCACPFILFYFIFLFLLFVSGSVNVLDGRSDTGLQLADASR